MVSVRPAIARNFVSLSNGMSILLVLRIFELDGKSIYLVSECMYASIGASRLTVESISTASVCVASNVAPMILALHKRPVQLDVASVWPGVVCTTAARTLDTIAINAAIIPTRIGH